MERIRLRANSYSLLNLPFLVSIWCIANAVMTLMAKAPTNAATSVVGARGYAFPPRMSTMATRSASNPAS